MEHTVFSISLSMVRCSENALRDWTSELRTIIEYQYVSLVNACQSLK